MDVIRLILVDNSGPRTSTLDTMRLQHREQWKPP